MTEPTYDNLFLPNRHWRELQWYPILRKVNQQTNKIKHKAFLLFTTASSPVKLVGYSAEQKISLESVNVLIWVINRLDNSDMSALVSTGSLWSEKWIEWVMLRKLILRLCAADDVEEEPWRDKIVAAEVMLLLLDELSSSIKGGSEVTIWKLKEGCFAIVFPSFVSAYCIFISCQLYSYK